MGEEGSSSKSAKQGSAWKFGLGLLWLVFNLSLAAWWLVFGLRQIGSDHVARGADFAREQRMLISEGSILILSLLIGGGALLYYIVRERRRGNEIRGFFATFSHELKTAIASLRLQVESLADDFNTEPANPLFTRLVKDSVRLEIQLENSLHLAQLDSNRFFPERLDLRRMLGSLAHQWPGTTLEVEGDSALHADRRALETVVKNLIQNAIVHGGAKKVSFVLRPLEGSRVSLRIRDDGFGFRGNFSQLGNLFVRHNSQSGSGVGLFLVRTLVSRMGGETRFIPAEGGNSSGFDVEIVLPADRKAA